jgi:hypothetical protein
MRKNDELAALLVSALDIVQRDGDTRKSPTAALTSLLPAGVQLYASQAASMGGRPGLWNYYLVMPRGWEPPDGGRRWMHNYDGGYYWDTGTGVPWAIDRTNTQKDALKGGLIRLLEVL